MTHRSKARPIAALGCMTLFVACGSSGGMNGGTSLAGGSGVINSEPGQGGSGGGAGQSDGSTDVSVVGADQSEGSTEVSVVGAGQSAGSTEVSVVGAGQSEGSTGVSGGGAGQSGGGATGVSGGGADQSGGSTGVSGGTGGDRNAAGSGGVIAGSGGTGGRSAGEAGSGGVIAGSGGAEDGGAGAGGGTGMMGSCVGEMVPTSDPTKAGPFEVTSDKMVGPVAGAPNDPLYGDTPLNFNVYRPNDLATGGYCFPIIIWSNGHGDQPEPVPSVGCDPGKCGRYLPLLEQFASHGFVVVVALSSQASQGDPLPSMIGLDWILEQADDSASPYYHHLDTSNIGAAGHSEGGFTSSRIASDPRFSAIATVAGSAANAEIHQPTVYFCGGNDPTVSCDSVETNFETITDVPAMFINNESTNHLNWATQGMTGPTLLGFLAWFRVHLMNDTANREYFYGPSCTFCSDNRVTVQRNSLMMTP